MNNSLIRAMCAVCGILALPATSFADPAKAPVSVIVDTEMSSDCDAAGALAVLHKLADGGEARILACMVDAVEPDHAVGATIAAINAYYGRPDIPIGSVHSSIVRPGKSRFTASVRDEFPTSVGPDTALPSAVDVYRRVLAAAPDKSVTVVSLGFVVNLSDLLKSGPDSFSKMTGVDLVRAKVKQLVVVGGRFKPSDWERQTAPEYNFGGSNKGEAPNTKFVVDQWPTDILFVGMEAGQGVTSGPTLVPLPAADPVRRIYELFGALVTPRSSWGQVAVLAAVRDPEEYWTVQRDGYCVVTPTGLNTWSQEPHRGHSYLAYKQPFAAIQSKIGELMAEPPGANKPMAKAGL